MSRASTAASGAGGSSSPSASADEELLVIGQVPSFQPRPEKPGRNTNQLEYLRDAVIKDVRNHKHSRPFLSPVDAVELNIPDML